MKICCVSQTLLHLVDLDCFILRLCAFHLPRADRNGRSVLRQAGDAMNVLIMSLLHMHSLACVRLAHPSKLLVEVSKGRQQIRAQERNQPLRRCRSKTPARAARVQFQQPLHAKPGNLAEPRGAKRKGAQSAPAEDDAQGTQAPAEGPTPSSSSALQASLAEARRQRRKRSAGSGAI